MAPAARRRRPGRGRRPDGRRGLRRARLPSSPGRLAATTGASPPRRPGSSPGRSQDKIDRMSVRPTTRLVAHGEPPRWFTFSGLAALGLPHVTTTRHFPGVTSPSEPTAPVQRRRARRAARGRTGPRARGLRAAGARRRRAARAGRRRLGRRRRHPGHHRAARAAGDLHRRLPGRHAVGFDRPRARRRARGLARHRARRGPRRGAGGGARPGRAPASCTRRSRRRSGRAATRSTSR